MVRPKAPRADSVAVGDESQTKLMRRIASGLTPSSRAAASTRRL
jgi:hypothetical protein